MKNISDLCVICGLPFFIDDYTIHREHKDAQRSLRYTQDTDIV